MSASTPCRRALAGALLVALVAGACTTSQALPTFTIPPGQDVGGELYVGTLMAGRGTPCIQVKQLGYPAVALVWPAGFTARYNPLRVYDTHGTEVASEGDLVTAGGVYVDKWSTACQTQDYFEVMEIQRGGLEETGP